MLAEVGGRTGLRSARAARSPWRRRLVWAAALAVALAVLFLLAFSQSRSSALSSDGASNILQASAMLHGNPLLRGWWTSDVSFYTTELPEYALVVAARGLTPDVVHICGALTYVLAVALAGLAARGRAAGAVGLRRAGIAVAIMLAPSVLGGTEVFLENPDHFGTSVPLLLALLLLDWGQGRAEASARRWYVPLALCALLALAQVGDELSLVVATVPVAAVCLFRLVVSLIRRRPLAELRWDGLLAAAALISIAVARIAERVLRAAGGFDQRPIPGSRLAPLHHVPANARLLYQSVVLLFGANNPGAPGQSLTLDRHLPLVLSADLHVIGLLVAGAGLIAGIAAGYLGWPGRPGGPHRVDWADRDRVVQILVVAIGVTLAAGLFTTVLQTLSSAHEIAVLLPLGAVLAGRTLPASARPLVRRLADARARRSRDSAVRRPPATMAAVTTAVTIALAGWLAVGLAEAAYGATWPATAVPMQDVAGWLVAHHQQEGLASYWQATDTSVASGGRVVVAPVTTSAGAAKHWESSSTWYQPSQSRATFVIAGDAPRSTENSLSVARVRAQFGRPAAEYHVGVDVIMIYRYNLLTRLNGRAFPGPS
jgi:hypothetical protein